ncbi:MAG: hypothetical protein ACPLX8_00725 [Nanopusillaceae archaeon]
MGIIENLKETTKLFMDSFLGSLVAGIIFGFLGVLLFGGNSIMIPLLVLLGYGGLAVPIISSVAFAFLYPRVMKWYYENVTGQRVNPNYTVATVILLVILLAGVIPQVIVYYGILSGSIGLRELATWSLLGALVQLVLLVVWSYNLFGAIIGKVNSYSPNIFKSLILIVHFIIAGIIFGIISLILGLVLALFIILSPLVGFILTLIVSAIFGAIIATYISLLGMIVVKNS